MRAIIESLTPRRSAGTASGLEARPAVAHEHLGAPVLDLGVERDRLRAGELRRVHERLAGGGDQRARRARRAARRRRSRPRSARGGRTRPRPRRPPARPPASPCPRAACRSATPAARAPGGARARRPRAGRRRASARARASAAPSRAGARRPRRAPGSGSARRARRSARARAGSTTGARMIVTAISATATGSITSRAGADVVERQEQQRAADHERGAHAGAVDRLAAAAVRGARAARARSGTGARSARRPAAAITTGQVISSLNHRPHSRSSSAGGERQAGRYRPRPASVSRRVSKRATTGRSGPSAGISAQPMA